MTAVELGNTHLINFLIDAGADLDMRDRSGSTALHYAVIGFQLQVVTILLSRGSDENAMNEKGWTPLHLAAGKGKEWKDVVAALLQTNVKVNQRNSFFGSTPLHWACSWGHTDTVRLLLNHKGIDANVLDIDGNTPLHVAVREQCYDVVTLMLSQCCTELNLKKEEWYSGVVVARYLANHGADLYHKNNNNNTPLDLIKDPNLKQRWQTFSPPQCLWCGHEEATTKFHPCGHLITCEECSTTSLKLCLRCLKPITSRGGVGIFLDIKTSELDIIKRDNRNDTIEQSYQMLYKWFTSCDPKKRTAETIKAALEEAQCFNALQCLSLGIK
ncbi:E3 ubiquitin-protein ligase MIB2-like isoform X3 [Octopus vulgaris]|nr:E3 ubiquitin-protein ligase MIB2-like isoform X3 [Octopus vulgaris]